MVRLPVWRHVVVAAVVLLFGVLTLLGTIGSQTDERTTSTTVVDDAPLVPATQPSRATAALIVTAAGGLAALAVLTLAFLRGRNAVYAGDPTGPRSPGPGARSPEPTNQPTALVSDRRLGEMVKFQFVPPSGVAPWTAQVVLTETFSDATLRAYWSGLAADQVVTFEPVGDGFSISPGPRRDEASPLDRQFTDHLFAIKNPFVTGIYDASYESMMRNFKPELVASIQRQHWWRHGGPKVMTGSSSSMSAPGRASFAVPLAAIFIGAWVLVSSGIAADLIPAAVVAAVVCGAVAYVMYKVLMRSRTAAGSAVALEAAGFRQFLQQPKTHHVESAQQHGLLREYSAWAVALDEVESWTRALNAASVPADDASRTPLLAFTRWNSIFNSSFKLSRQKGHEST